MTLKCAIDAQASSELCAVNAHDINFAFVHHRHMDVEWIKARKRDRGITDADLAKVLGVERSVANKIANGRVEMSVRRIDEVAGLFGVSREEMMVRAGLVRAATLEPDQPPIRTASASDGPIAIRQLDLSYAMGDGTNPDDFPQETPVLFDPNWLRIVSRAPPDRLFVARGDGDSMAPTLINDDQVLIDTTQQVVNLQDRIWALSVHGAAMIKRLRLIGQGAVQILSDNPAVPSQEVEADDVHIVGRVIWVGRRI